MNPYRNTPRLPNGAYRAKKARKWHREHTENAAYPATPIKAAERSLRLPRMSKKRKEEWSFFLNHRNRITYNDLCRGCTRDCKQSFRAIIVLCPRYYSKRWKKEGAANGR